MDVVFDAVEHDEDDAVGTDMPCVGDGNFFNTMSFTSVTNVSILFLHGQAAVAFAVA